ncbi:glycosyltransferase [Paraburkholderia flava]|uniref:glycosyltransferase n=1 Tax=Paraburkholderia flava TaxID=2547393 RepID=UPI00105DF0AE|nr:glycosyltransferase [Paraburkholderia flava]
MPPVEDDALSAAELQDQIDALTEELGDEQEALRVAQKQLTEAREDLAALRASTSWRLTAPLRSAIAALPRLRRILGRIRFARAVLANSIREEGWRATLQKIATAPRRHGIRKLMRALRGGASVALYELPPAKPALDLLALRVLIVAETSIPQCLKYRVTQKQRMIKDLGVDCTVVSWTETEKCRSLLQTHSVAIFYRVPGYPVPMQIIAEAKALGLATFWEVDDLIFDIDKYVKNSNLEDLDPEMRRNVLAGIPLYRNAMLACERTIASTSGLAEAMREAGIKDVLVIENALDEETVRTARRVNRTPKQLDGLVRIVYGSGTKTHDADFRVASTAIARVLKARPEVRLRVIGELNLPADYSELNRQIERLPLSNYATYLKRVGECDINIAPLEPSVFNDAKSNIKYLEASIVGLPSVCSPAAAFETAIKDGHTGYLASDEKSWENALLALVDDSTLRREVAERAYAHVTIDYSPHTIANTQIAPMLAPYRREKQRLRVLGANILFAPRSFGGATIIIEEMARRLNSTGDLEYVVFTTLPVNQVPAYDLVRYESTAGSVFAMGLPVEKNPQLDFENPHASKAFREALRASRPDVVHLHSVQGIGAQIAEVCNDEGIPFVVTLHDAWWICGRQFMVTGENRYCNQRKIDLAVCSVCVDNAHLNTYRQSRLREILQSAALLISPSEFFKQLYVDNGFDGERISVNKNGILPPRAQVHHASLRDRPLRFGYVGGETEIKGAHLIRDAFRRLQHRNYELHVVDNTLNVGFPSIDPAAWKIPGTLKISRAYTQETIDDFFENVDVLLFPTQWKESFGLTVREALIRDVWVIATDAGGVIEDIVAGENGEIIPLNDDGTALAAAIDALLQNPQRLDGYRNPHAKQIRLFDEQARELHDLLAQVASHSRVEAEAAVTVKP